LATNTRDEPQGLGPVLDDFSETVRAIVGRLDVSGATVWQLADGLLQEHLAEYPSSAISSLALRSGVSRPTARWLELVAGLIELEAVAALSRSPVIDSSLLLLGLARLDRGLDRVLRETKIRWRLEDGLGYQLDQVFRPWALPLRPTEWIELSTLGQTDPDKCAFSPDGSLLAITTLDGTAFLWDVLAGSDVATLSGHTGRIMRCAFSPDGRLLATVSGDGTGRLWDVANGDERFKLIGHTEAILACDFSPDGTLFATAAEDGTARLWDVATGSERGTLSGHTNRVVDCAFSPDGKLLATASWDGSAQLWDAANNGGVGVHATLSGHTGHVLGCAFSPGGSLVATAGEDGTARLWDVANGSERATLVGHTKRVSGCVFSPDGSLLATSSSDSTARLWMVASGSERATLNGHTAELMRSAFRSDGALLATTSVDGTTRLWDVAAGIEQAVLVGPGLAVLECEFSPDGRLLATTSIDGVARIWEEVQTAGDLPAVVPDVAQGVDLIGVGSDADAIARLIAASQTAAPLSIGLFGDWGSGKSFLVNEIQTRVQRLSLRAQRTERSAYCRFVRNISFNAWQYADANLWASLVTHIFDALAKAEPLAGVNDESVARAQVARLEEELAARSELAARLERASERARVANARRRLLRWAWVFAGVAGESSPDQLETDLKTIRGTTPLLLPNARVRRTLLVAALLIAALVFGILALLGVSRAIQLISTACALVAAPLAALKLLGSHLSSLLAEAGEAARSLDAPDSSIDAELEAARTAERDLRQELTDLRSGRRIARVAMERETAGDYRAHLGLVSRIHDDFMLMSNLLQLQSVQADRGGGTADAAELPRIDRIVLYIDDLDRCPPERVIEVLEAVHLILAVPLFVVVLAVDPRWLLQSLRFHYSELLAQSLTNDADGDDGETRWHPTPVHYLEKIIQVPFALRPIGGRSARLLVHGLLPVEPTRSEADPGDLGEATAGPSEVDASPTAAYETDAMRARTHQDLTVSGPPSMSPRTLAITEHERDVAAAVATAFSTPRTVKKFTNLYRLFRVSLDEPSGQLDRFLNDDTDDAPEFQAVLILLAMIIAFPEEASDFLLGLGSFAPGSSSKSRAWSEYLHPGETRPWSRERLHHVAPKPWSPELRWFLDAVTPTHDKAALWTCEPFRRWALEVSRYSFATGQEVFARVRGPV
jgi:hypothetical protein